MSGAGIDQGLAAQHSAGATPAAWSLIETIGPSQTRSPCWRRPRWRHSRWRTRSRATGALGGFAATGLKLLEAADIEEPLGALESALAAGRTGGASDRTSSLLDG
jgi:hypothetical protein